MILKRSATIFSERGMRDAANMPLQPTGMDFAACRERRWAGG